MSQYNIIVSTAEATVVSEYEPQQTRSDAYQSEAALEAAFIKQLTEQGYTYLQIHSSDELVKNLREQLERLNGYHFSEDEWKRFFSQNLANSNDGIVEKTRLIQEDNVQVLKRDDGSSKNITLIDKKNIHNNSVQVINQYVENGGNFDNRYDVSILVNGFPLVHIELKRRGVALKEAFNQIERYQRDSFWAASGLYEYVQLFVISNGTRTKYYSNTTRISAIKERDGKKKVQKTSSSFEFTSFWADANNKVMIRRLLELVVPEIQDGVVLLKGVAREAGSRTKVSVISRDPDVDAVGACIGNRGMRIAEIVEELRGEKIDVVLFSEKPEEYIAAALSPASVIDVDFDGERSATVWVDSDQLSLAIGKEGQNVRLAVRLTGYKIDIKSRK